jgi:hypothetical protein
MSCGAVINTKKGRFYPAFTILNKENITIPVRIHSGIPGFQGMAGIWPAVTSNNNRRLL